MADLLRDRLQSSLGGAYTLERELGGGGMSRVFVAREEALGRDVVVKVLSPELAEGLSAERFAREIRLAARLQHPNVVPVLTTGVAADGLPYYTMPYVRGESLRARLLRGRVPRDEALTILRDVLRALGAAHRDGVVHRDVKPENVLLHDGAAVVTDFGIAKALAESRTLAQEGERHDDGSGTITRLGTTLGTPAYMAPEQATGDRVDARADLYAWGVVAHELLAGQHPFAGKENAQQWIAAHLTEPPPALPADVRAPLAALVRQCLEKEPARRPADAATALAALDRTAPDRAAPDHAGVTGPAVPAPLPAGEADAPAHPRRRWRRLLAAVPAGLLAVALGGWYGLLSASDRAMLTVLATRDPLELRVNRVVVAPFRNETGDPSLAALGPLVADVLTSGLASLPGVEVVDARTAAASADVVRRIPRLLRRRDATLALADEVGAGVLLDGSYYRDGDSVRVRARVLDASSGAVRRALPEVAVAPTAPADGLRRLAERTVALMRAASDPGNNMPLREFDIPNSLPATEAVLAGYAAYLRSDTAAFALMDRAVALDTGFVGAYGARAFVLATLGAARRPARADAALEDARARRDRMLPPAQALTDMAGAAREAAVPRLLDAAEHYLAAVPLSPEGRLAVGRYALDARRPRRVLDVLQGMDTDRGAALAVADATWWRIAIAAAQLGDAARARSAIAEAQRRAPNSATARAGALAVAGALGDPGALEDAATRDPRRPVAPGRAAALALLAMRGGRPTEARALAGRWASARAPGAARTISQLLDDAGVAAMADDWAGVLARTEHAATAVPLAGASWADSVAVLGVRGAALAHLGRGAEARALEAALARDEDRPWGFGAPTLARARIAAQLGETPRAVTLAETAARRWTAPVIGGLRTMDSDPFLRPLRDDPRFRALVRPSPEDAH